MSSEISLTALGLRIAESVEVIDTFSAHVSSPFVGLLPADAPQDVQRARQALLEATQRIQLLCTGPSEFLEHHQIYVIIVH
jgi:hypothetical protein